jgi:hypothetical protein
MKGWLDRYKDGGSKKKATPNLDNVFTKLGISAKNFIDPMAGAVAASDISPTVKPAEAKPFELRRDQLSATGNKNEELSNFYKEKEAKRKFNQKVGEAFQTVGAITEPLALIPTPITEPLGMMGGAANIVGSSLLASNDVSEGNYLGALGNLAMAATALPGAALANPKNIRSLAQNLPKAKSINEAIGAAFADITPASSLPRMTASELKNARIAQNLGRLGAKKTPKTELMQRALDQGLSEDVFHRGFGMSREAAQRQLTGSSRSNDLIRALFGREGTQSERERIRQMFEGMSSPPSTTTPRISGSQRDQLIDMMNGIDSEDAYNIDQYLYNDPEFGVNPYTGSIRERFNDARNNLADAIKSTAKEFISPYKHYTGSPKEVLGYLTMNSSGEKGVSDRIAHALSEASQYVDKGNVFTGSLDTSHNSYLTQLKQIFGDASSMGQPVYLGDYGMNSMGMLSRFRYKNDEVAKYLNSEIDDLIRKKKIPSNILRPTTTPYGTVSLPQYGIKKNTESILDEAIKNAQDLPDLPFENGGELNYNNYTVHASPDFVGEGYSNRGRNYSPAWGGQFAMGGSIPGAVGFTYARTNDPAPSNGPYAKKTKASAENGTEMRYYQEGLDFKPKTISKDGDNVAYADNTKVGRVPRYISPKKGEDMPVSRMIEMTLGAPQRLGVQAITGKEQYPSEAMGIKNPWGALAVDAVLDPLNFVGVGGAKALAKSTTAANKIKAAKSISKAPKGSYESLVNEIKGRFNPEGKKSIEEGNKWLKDWISHPETQKKIDEAFHQAGGGLYNMSNSVRDAYNATKSYTPDVKAYPLINQVSDFVDLSLFGKTPKYGYDDMIHTGNRGTSYTHHLTPPSTKFHKRFGEWTSLNPDMNEIERASTTIHEGTHGWVRQPVLNYLGHTSFVKDRLSEPIRNALFEKQYLKSKGHNEDEIRKIMGDNNFSLTYFGNPSEVHARTMEIRNAFGIKPGQKITADDWNRIQMEGANKPNRIADYHFGLFKDAQSAADVMNKLLVAPAAVGVGAAAMANQPDMKQGGQLTKLDQLSNFTNYNTKQPGGWLDKYEG